jgi:hypothetical protein
MEAKIREGNPLNQEEEAHASHLSLFTRIFIFYTLILKILIKLKFINLNNSQCFHHHHHRHHQLARNDSQL